MLHSDELVWGENGWTELGEKLVNPQLESLLLDPEFQAIVNHDLCTRNVGFLQLCWVASSSVSPFGRPLGL